MTAVKIAPITTSEAVILPVEIFQYRRALIQVSELSRVIMQRWGLTMRMIAIAGVVLFTSLPAKADPCTAPLPKPKTEFTGIVRYVGDGDSICVGRSAEPSQWIEIRVADFYAPELHAKGGKEAKATMQRIAFGKPVSCIAGKRSYDRVVAQCHLAGTSLGDLMRRAGIEEGGRGR